MPEKITALVYLLFLALPVFWLAKQPIARITGEKEYSSDRNLWLATTLILFLSPNFWLYACIAGLVFFHYGKLHGNPLAMYCLVLTAAPQLANQIPGPGPIDYLFTINHYRLLNLTVLFPFAIRLYKTRAQRRRVSKGIDLMVMGLIFWVFIMQALSDSIADTGRAGLYAFLDVWLPYYVGSRALNKLDDYSRLAATLVLVCTIAAVVAVFESARHWLLYSALQQSLGRPDAITTYLSRGSDGPLRATFSLGHPIVLGYVLFLALGMAAFMYPKFQPTWKIKLSLLGLSAGLIATLARGPWIGAAAMFLTLFALGPGFGKRIVWALFGGGVAILILLISPLGDTVIAYLPFVGKFDSGSVDYRSKLFDVSLIVFKQHPFAGDFHFMKNPIMEQMRQGEGIIDIVNTYLQYALPYGSIGLFLFCAPFVMTLRGIKRMLKKVRDQSDIERLGRTLFGMLVGTLVIIMTVSSIGLIPILYWLLVGLGVGYIRIFGAPKIVVKQRVARESKSVPIA